MSSNNPFSLRDDSGDNQQSYEEQVSNAFSAQDALNRMSNQGPTGYGPVGGYDEETFRVDNSAFAAVREQSVLVKSMFFMCLALAISAVAALAGWAYGESNIYSYFNTMTPAIIAELVVFFLASFAMKKDNFVLSLIGYVGYSLISGYTLSIVFFAYQLGSVVTIFAITSVMFGALAVYGYTTKADLTPLGSFLYMGLVGIVLVGFVNLFMHNDMISNIVAVIGVVIFSGLTAYDIQKMKQINVERSGSSEMTVAMYCGLQLYLDFINLFLKLLRLFAKSRD